MRSLAGPGYDYVTRLFVLLFAAGVAFVQQQAVLPPLWLGLVLALCGGALHALFRVRGPASWRPVALGLVAFFIGLAWAVLRAEHRLQDRLDEAWAGQDVELIGVVDSLPQPFSRGWRFEMAVEKVLTASARLPGKIALAWYQGKAPLPALYPGQRWRLTVRLKPPHGTANPGGFDYEAWLFQRGIAATGYVRPSPVQQLGDAAWSPALWAEATRQRVRQGFADRLPAQDYPYAGVLVALAIGDQKAIAQPLWTIFNRTGTTHLMSISGLHVTMVAGLIGALAGALWRRWPGACLYLPVQRLSVLVACLGAAVYVLLAGFAIPAQRTLYMLLVAGAALFLHRRLAPSRVLALALLVVLLLDPWAVLAAGFWLSFGAVAALLYVVAAQVGSAGGWRGHVAAWGQVQWAATLASLPILLWLFQQFSLVSPLANALAVPVVSFIITPLSLLAALLPWAPIAQLAHAVLALLMYFLQACASWPLWQVPAPPLVAALLAAAGVVVCLLPRGIPGRWLGGCLLLPALFWPIDRPGLGEARVDVLDVGQGLAVVVRTASHVLIYDPGPQYGGEADAGQRVVLPFLRWLGVDRVDRLLVTHRDSDHAGGTASLLAALPVGDILSSARELGGTPCLDGERWQWDGVDFLLLHPQAADYAAQSSSNHLSCVLRVSAGGQRVLLTSDIEAAAERALLQRAAPALAADVLLVPHHGSRSSSTPEFLAAVAARHAVIPVGERNRFGHPAPQVLGRLQASGARIWRTDRQGAIHIALRPASPLEVSHWRDGRQRYWHRQ